MLSRKTIGIIVLVGGLLVAACSSAADGNNTVRPSPTHPMAKRYSSKPDFAEVERKYPLTPSSGPNSRRRT